MQRTVDYKIPVNMKTEGSQSCEHSRLVLFPLGSVFDPPNNIVAGWFSFITYYVLPNRIGEFRIVNSIKY